MSKMNVSLSIESFRNAFLYLEIRWNDICKLFILALISVVLFVWNKRRRTSSLINRFPGMQLRFFNVFGHLSDSVIGRFKEQMHSPEVYDVLHVCGYHELFRNEIFFHAWVSYKPAVVLVKPSVLQTFLTQNTELDKGFFYNFLHPLIGTGLLTSSGSKWKQRRKLLTPAFHFNILRGFVPVFNNHSGVLINILKTQKDKDWMDIVPLITGCSLDIICDSILGVQVNAQAKADSEYVKAQLSLAEECFVRLRTPWFWPDFIFRMSTTGKSFTRNVQIVHRFTNQVIAEKKQLLKSKSLESDKSSSKYKKKGLLDLLLDEHMRNENINEEDIREEVDTFISEGHETTAMGMCWALYLIGLYPEIQREIHAELDCIFFNDVDRPITMDDLRDMKYLECVLKESQRLYPSAPLYGRDLKDDMIIDGITIPRGTVCAVNTYALHRDPDVFPNPEKFDPERFFPENCKGRHPFAYLPFSAGPRNCIGQRFAMMEEKTVIANVLRHFRIQSLDPRDKIQLVFQFVLRPAYGLRIRFEQRN